jgi:hypothetical protein
MRALYACAIVAVSLTTGSATVAQTTTNPDITVIPHFLIITDDSGKLEKEYPEPSSIPIRIMKEDLEKVPGHRGVRGADLRR